MKKTYNTNCTRLSELAIISLLSAFFVLAGTVIASSQVNGNSAHYVGLVSKRIVNL